MTPALPNDFFLNRIVFFIETISYILGLKSSLRIINLKSY